MFGSRCKVEGVEERMEQSLKAEARQRDVGAF